MGTEWLPSPLRLQQPPFHGDCCEWALYIHTYIQALEKQIYIEWEERWISNNAYRRQKKFCPKPHKNRAKIILKMKRPEIKALIEIITGQNNLNCMERKDLYV